MKVRESLLLITTSYPEKEDGSEAAGSFVADLVKELAEIVDVTVIAPGRRTTVDVNDRRIAVYRFRAPPKALGNLRLWHPLDLLRIIVTLSSGKSAVMRAATERKITHTFALWALPSGYWARLLWLAKGIPYSVWMLGSDIWSLGRIPVVRSLLAVVMRDAQCRFADGLQLADDAQKIARRHVKFLPTTRNVHPPRLEIKRISPPYSFVFIGRWHRNKGIDLLLDAIALLDADDWMLVKEFRIFGGGPLESVVRQKGEILLKNGRPVVVGGYIDKQDAEMRISNADYVLIPSRIESIPVVFSDAIKLNRPVIATPVGDFCRLFQSASFGILAAGVSSVDICRAIQMALRTSSTSFMDGLKIHAECFDLKNIAEKICGAAAHDDSSK
ncbi:MAG: glycosyltransferase [Rudaea sp.]